MDATEIELRVLGSLIEKQRTTPDQYPLSLNTLRLACNQTTSREPVLELDESELREALERLGRRGWTRLASGAGSRAVKYRHLFGEALGLASPELALLSVLMLRGPQTPGELKTRSERQHGFASVAEVVETLDGLAARELVVRQPRRPGQKEDRYAQLLGGEAPEPAREVTAEPNRIDELEERVATLELELDELRRRLASFSGTPERGRPGSVPEGQTPRPM